MDHSRPIPKQRLRSFLEAERPGRKGKDAEEGKGRLSIQGKLRVTGERLVGGRMLAVWGDTL